MYLIRDIAMFQKLFFIALLFVTFCSTSVAEQTNSNLDIAVTAKSIDYEHVQMQPNLVAGKTTKFSLKITGKYDNGAVAGLHPAAWIRPALNNRSSCKDAVRNYLQVGPNATQDIDLNSYSFITLNQDNSIGIMDPNLNLATANLLALKTLKGNVTSWYLDSARGEIFVTQPELKQISVINALNGNLIKEISLSVSPEKILVDNKNSTLWMLSNRAIVAIDIASRSILKIFPIKSENILVTLSPDDEKLWLYNKTDGVLKAIDTVTLKLSWKRVLLKNLTSLSYSYYANSLYLANTDAQEIITLFPTINSKIRAVKLQEQPEKLLTTPDGQWLFVLALKKQQLLIIDTATNQIKHQLVFRNEYDQITFSDLYAYIHHISSPKASLIQLDTLASIESPSLIEVPFGLKPSGKQAENLPSVVPFPEGGAVLASNAADKTLFVYMEDGMLAPNNAFKVYTAPPRAVLIHDKTLTETQPGVYETVSIIPRPGKYEMVFYLDSPLVVSCFPLTVEGEGNTAEVSFQSSVTDIEIQPKNYKSGKPETVKLKLLTKKPAKNVELSLLFFRPGTNWQKRIKVKTNDQLEFSVNVVFPEVGSYLLAVESRQLNLNYSQKKILNLEVSE